MSEIYKKSDTDYYICFEHGDIIGNGLFLQPFNFKRDDINDVVQKFLRELSRLIQSNKCIELDSSVLFKVRLKSVQRKTFEILCLYIDSNSWKDSYGSQKKI